MSEELLTLVTSAPGASVGGHYCGKSCRVCPACLDSVWLLVGCFALNSADCGIGLFSVSLSFFMDLLLANGVCNIVTAASLVVLI